MSQNVDPPYVVRRERWCENQSRKAPYPKNHGISSHWWWLEIPEPCEKQSQTPRFWRLQWFLARWWFQICFIFTPIWGRFPIWLIILYIFQLGWNHQLVRVCSISSIWDAKHPNFGPPTPARRVWLPKILLITAGSDHPIWIGIQEFTVNHCLKEIVKSLSDYIHFFNTSWLYTACFRNFRCKNWSVFSKKNHSGGFFKDPIPRNRQTWMFPSLTKWVANPKIGGLLPPQMDGWKFHGNPLLKWGINGKPTKMDGVFH